MKRQRILLSIMPLILGITMIIGLSACDDTRSNNQKSSEQDSASANFVAEGPAPVQANVIAPAEVGAPAPPAENEQTGVITVSTDQTASQQQTTQQTTQRMVIKNGELSLMVEDTQAAINQITAIAGEYSGYVVSSETTASEPYNTAQIAIAVEVENFEAAMNAVRQIGMKILHDSASGQDVTSEYVDLESRLRSLEATRDRIMTFLEKATTVEETLRVNDELAAIEQQIEEVKGRMNFLSGRSAFSTITVNLREPDPPVTPTPTPTSSPTPTPKPGWTPGDTLDSAVDAQKDLLKVLASAAIWLVVFLGPYVLIAGLVAFGGQRWVRRRLK